MIRTIDTNVDVMYSPDEGGYYLQRFGDRLGVSVKLYTTEQAAIRAYQAGKAKFA